jgi:hypothetical protein
MGHVNKKDKNIKNTFYKIFKNTNKIPNKIQQKLKITLSTILSSNHPQKIF